MGGAFGMARRREGGLAIHAPRGCQGAYMGRLAFVAREDRCTESQRRFRQCDWRGHGRASVVARHHPILGVVGPPLWPTLSTELLSCGVAVLFGRLLPKRHPGCARLSEAARRMTLRARRDQAPDTSMRDRLGMSSIGVLEMFGERSEHRATPTLGRPSAGCPVDV